MNCSCIAAQGHASFLAVPTQWDSKKKWPHSCHQTKLMSTTHFLSTKVLFPLIDYAQFSSVQFSRSVMSNSLRPRGLQHARPPCSSPTPGVYSNPCPLSRWCLQPSYPLSSPSPTLNLSQHQGLFKRVSSSHQVAKVLEFQLQHQSFQWTLRTDLL